jgi:mRNA interferase MazF
VVIWQGQLYWFDFGEPRGSEPGYHRPVVVVSNDVANASAIRTVVVCAVTSNLRLASARWNVLLNAGEANLPRPSVVNVSQESTLNKADLPPDAYIGQVSDRRIDEIVANIALSMQRRRPVRP